MKKYDFIFTITKKCNYQCSYCNFKKNKNELQGDDVGGIIDFLNTNHEKIHSFKFFGGEPLIRFDQIKNILDAMIFSERIFEIVTNFSLINDEILGYFDKFFGKISISVDNENIFDFDSLKRLKKIRKDRIYFNIIFNPGYEKEGEYIFLRLYDLGYRNFNILPVYYTKIWTKENLKNLSVIIKVILDLKKIDESLHLSGFQENQGKKTNLINEKLYIDTDLRVYFSDAVDTTVFSHLKKQLYIGELKDVFKSRIDLEIFRKRFDTYGQIQDKGDYLGLHKLMDYFSLYLNHPQL